MITAIIQIRCSRDLVTQTAEAIAELSGITEVYSVSGDYDLYGLVHRIESAVKQHSVKAIIVEPYHDRKIAEKVAESTGAKVVNFCQFPGGLPNTDTYIALIDILVNNLVATLK